MCSDHRCKEKAAYLLVRFPTDVMYFKQFLHKHRCTEFNGMCDLIKYKKLALYVRCVQRISDALVYNHTQLLGFTPVL